MGRGSCRLAGRTPWTPSGVVAEALGVELDVAPATGRPGTPAGARSCRGRRRSSATPASCTRGCARRTASRAHRAPSRSTSTPARAGRGGAPAPTFSSYPVAKEDVALVVDAAVAAADVEAALREGAGELLESIRLFDLYTGEQVGAGKKSLAFALRFRAPDRTLKESEAAAARDAAVAVAAERRGPSSAPDSPGAVD